MHLSFNSNVSGQFFESFVKQIFTFLAEKNLLINDSNQHIIAIKLRTDGHHVVLQNLFENKKAENIEFIDESIQTDTNKTVVFSYNSKHITMTFSGENGKVKKLEKGTEKYVNPESKSFVFYRKNFDFLEIKTKSLNNLLNLISKETTFITSQESNQLTGKIRLKFLIKKEEQQTSQIEKLHNVYKEGEIFFFKKSPNISRVEALATRFTCQLNDLTAAQHVDRLNAIPSQNKLSIFREIILQLEKRGYPHGDMKPWNIFLREEVETNTIYIKILDADFVKIDGHIRNASGGSQLMEELGIGDIAMEIVEISYLALKLVDKNLSTMLREISSYLEDIEKDNPNLKGSDAVLERIYRTITQHISLYVNSSQEKHSVLPTIESIKEDINQVVRDSRKNNKLS
ncbi:MULTISPECIES: hypothetical protein [unclassified Legionella]|uniref:hypothetical protein n=1 Tax=unclassified Legionella TaxID=2622702 RepID=UPI001055A128|nr:MULTISPECIES: hypothetical protein [unclassified Legionella]MDI9818591.1 hypothetical protein [Legionella sp. PL877]